MATETDALSGAASHTLRRHAQLLCAGRSSSKRPPPPPRFLRLGIHRGVRKNDGGGDNGDHGDVHGDALNSSVLFLRADKSVKQPNCMNDMLISYGYGSIPIDTIFRGMNIHLPAILMFTRGTRF